MRLAEPIAGEDDMSIIDRVGTLFTQDFLSVAVCDEAEYQGIDTRYLGKHLKSIFDDFPVN